MQEISEKRPNKSFLQIYEKLKYNMNSKSSLLKLNILKLIDIKLNKC